MSASYCAPAISTSPLLTAPLCCALCLWTVWVNVGVPEDKNMGLIQQCIKAARKHRIHRLTKVTSCHVAWAGVLTNFWPWPSLLCDLPDTPRSLGVQTFITLSVADIAQRARLADEQQALALVREMVCCISRVCTCAVFVL